MFKSLFENHFRMLLLKMLLLFRIYHSFNKMVKAGLRYPQVASNISLYYLMNLIKSFPIFQSFFEYFFLLIILLKFHIFTNLKTRWMLR